MPRIPEGQQGGYAYHVINRGNGRLTAVQYVRWQYEADTISLLSKRIFASLLRIPWALKFFCCSKKVTCVKLNNRVFGLD